MLLDLLEERALVVYSRSETELRKKQVFKFGLMDWAGQQKLVKSHKAPPNRILERYSRFEWVNNIVIKP